VDPGFGKGVSTEQVEDHKKEAAFLSCNGSNG